MLIVSKTILFFVIFAPAVIVAQVNKFMVITKPVVSVWIKPENNKGPYTYPLLSKDIPLHDTQLLCGDYAQILDGEGPDGWIKVAVLGQPGFDTQKNTWIWCDGWIEKDAGVIIDNIPLRKQTQPLDDIAHLRTLITTKVKEFVGSPYCWGGCSMYDANNKNTLTSVDCSGLLLYVFAWYQLCIPRNSHAQFLRTQAIEPAAMEQGDLVFLKYKMHNGKEDNFCRIRHVMMYLGNDMLFEATGDQGGGGARIISFEEKLGVKRNEANNGIRTDDYEIHCGTFFTSELLQILRNTWIDPLHKAWWLKH